MRWQAAFSVTCSTRYSLILATMLLFLWPAAAWSHAHPEQRTPAPDTTLEQAPQAVKIVFSEELEAAFSTLTVFDANGQIVNKDDSRVAKDNLHVLVAPLKTLAPGSYTVKWHVVSRDGHTTEGQYLFQVEP